MPRTDRYGNPEKLFDAIAFQRIRVASALFSSQNWTHPKGNLKSVIREVKSLEKLIGELKGYS